MVFYRGIHRNCIKKLIMERYKKFILFGIIIIAMGIVFSNTLENISESLGTVLIAVGGLFLIIGMSKKRKEEELKDKNDAEEK